MIDDFLLNQHEQLNHHLNSSFVFRHLNEIKSSLFCSYTFFFFFFCYDFQMRWALSKFCSSSSIPVFMSISTILLKTSSLLFLDTSCMPSILMHKRLSCCCNWSVIFYRLIFVCFSSKIWFWNIQFLELIFERYSSISFFNSSFKSFLKLSKGAEHISLAISLNEPF